MPLQGFPVILTAGLPRPAGGLIVGFDFRATSGFVTDNAPNTYVLATDTYPTTRGGFTFGWQKDNNSVGGNDRNSGIDVRLAGQNETAGWGGVPILSNTYFRVDLSSAGTYNIHLAMGDASFAQTSQRIEIRDNTTDLTFVISGDTLAGHWIDANGTNLTTATWPTTETSKSATFATTTLRMYCGDLTATNNTAVSYLGIGN